MLSAMKKSFFYFLGALALLTACAKEVEIPEDSAGKECVTIIAQTPATRTTASIEGSAVLFDWQTGEQIAVIEDDLLVEEDEIESVFFSVTNPPSAGAFEVTKSVDKDLIFAVSPARALKDAYTDAGEAIYTLEIPAVFSN